MSRNEIEIKGPIRQMGCVGTKSATGDPEPWKVQVTPDAADAKLTPAQRKEILARSLGFRPSAAERRAEYSRSCSRSSLHSLKEPEPDDAFAMRTSGGHTRSKSGEALRSMRQTELKLYVNGAQVVFQIFEEGPPPTNDVSSIPSRSRAGTDETSVAAKRRRTTVNMDVLRAAFEKAIAANQVSIHEERSRIEKLRTKARDSSSHWSRRTPSTSQDRLTRSTSLPNST